MAASDGPLSEIIDGYPPMCNLSARFTVPPIPAREVLASLSRKYEKYHPLTFDGLRFDLEEGRILVRSSNTEPIMRLNVEADDRPTAEALLNRFTEEIEQELASL